MYYCVEDLLEHFKSGAPEAKSTEQSYDSGSVNTLWLELYVYELSLDKVKDR